MWSAAAGKRAETWFQHLMKNCPGVLRNPEPAFCFDVRFVRLWFKFLNIGAILVCTKSLVKLSFCAKTPGAICGLVNTTMTCSCGAEGRKTPTRESQHCCSQCSRFWCVINCVNWSSVPLCDFDWAKWGSLKIQNQYFLDNVQMGGDHFRSRLIWTLSKKTSHFVCIGPP